jgi:hypothetical protein
VRLISAELLDLDPARPGRPSHCVEELLDVTRLIIARDRLALDGIGRQLIEEGRRALPDPYGDGTEEVLPATRRHGRCRICGEQADLTSEHIPPGAALNLGRLRVHTIEDWVNRQGDAMPGGVLKQGGIRGYTLCKGCNDLTGAQYGDEYRRWAITILEMLATAGTNVHELDAEPTTRRGTITLIGGDGRPNPRPGAFIRQILSMMCSVSAGYDLAGRFPSIRAMVLDSTAGTLPAGMSIGLTIYLSTRSRVVGPVLEVNTERRTWRWLMEVAHAPIAALMVLMSDRADDGPAHLCDISNFTQVSAKATGQVDASIEIGTAHHAQVGDYRTKAGVEADVRDTILVDRRTY